MLKYIYHPENDQHILRMKKEGYIVVMLKPEVIEHLVTQLGKATEASSDYEVIERNVWLRENLAEILENVRP